MQRLCLKLNIAIGEIEIKRKERRMRPLLSNDGENQAVLAFLALYGCCNNPTVKGMREHLILSGFDGCWPEWANTYDHHLTKFCAQNWLRYLFGLEANNAIAQGREHSERPAGAEG